MEVPIYQVDAFAGQLFSGNPAAVVPLEEDLPPATMQAIAAENNLAETAFVTTRGEEREIRWFTPQVEVDLCGHATMAAAHVLFGHLGCTAEQITFSSRSGPLHVRRDGELLQLDFPADPCRQVELAEGLIPGLGKAPEALYRGRDDFLAVYADEATVRNLVPDMVALAKIEARGVIISGPGEEVDFVSRFFAPQVGVPEDPVTGSAHTTLTPYWSERLGKQNLRARQLSPRGGELWCHDRGERVDIGGRAVTYLIGRILL